MPCIFVALALAVPRLVLAYLWFFTSWFTGLFETILWPLLGFFFAPTTLLWWTVVQKAYGGQWDTLQIVGMVIAVLIDISPSGGRRRRS